MSSTDPAAPLGALLAPFVGSPDRAALLFDFDGTLAPIVADPVDARAVPALVDALRALTARYAVVAAVSGRPVDFLAQHLPDEITLSGLYGLECRIDGRRVDHVEAETWRPVVAEAADRLVAARLGGMLLEDKGLSITLHYRQHPEVADAVAALATEVAKDVGLRLGSAKMSVELHPPIEVDKGSALRTLVSRVPDLAAVLYAGDDLGDLPAFDAMDRLASESSSGRPVATARVVVGGNELPTELADRADWIAPTPAALSELFEKLLA